MYFYSIVIDSIYMFYFEYYFNDNADYLWTIIIHPHNATETKVLGDNGI